MSNVYDEWNNIKKDVSARNNEIFFYDKEVWWVTLGQNIGSEQNGKGEYFVRPVLILKKINRHTFICIPLTRTLKDNEICIPFFFNNDINTALVAQIRILDRKRLLKKVGTIHINTFNKIKKATISFIK